MTSENSGENSGENHKLINKHSIIHYVTKSVLACYDLLNVGGTEVSPPTKIFSSKKRAELLYGNPVWEEFIKMRVRLS